VTNKHVREGQWVGDGLKKGKSVAHNIFKSANSPITVDNRTNGDRILSSSLVLVLLLGMYGSTIMILSLAVVSALRVGCATAEGPS
jgi:hypothetical protein